MKKKRISAFFLTIALLSGSLSSTAYAATWYMEDGDVIVSASESGQTVSQNNNTIGDNDPTFTNRDSSVASDSTITINTSGDATANITIEDINLKHSQESSIDVKGDSKADITVRGTNTINRKDESSPSMIHVSDGDLTLRGDGSLTLSGWTDGAKIGSNGFSQNTSCSNPAIGASEKADPDYNPAKAPMNGTITITDNAQVKIGSDTKFGTSRTPLIGEASSEPTGTGKIEISGNAAVSNIDGSSDIAIGGGTASSTIDISIGANTNINGTKGSDILDGKSSNVKLNTVKTPTLVPESAPAVEPVASVSNGFRQTESSAVSTESFCHSVTLSLPSAGLSNFSFCPACGKKDGKDFLSPVSDVSAQAVTGTLPAGSPVLCIGTLDNGVGIMSAAVIKHHRAVQPTGIVRFTVPASLLAGHRLVALHTDGTQSEIVMTPDNAQTLSFEVNYAANGNDSAFPVRMILLLPEAS